MPFILIFSPVTSQKILTTALFAVFAVISTVPVSAYDPFSAPPKNMKGVVYPQNAFAKNDFPPPPPIDFFQAGGIVVQEESYTGVLHNSSQGDINTTHGVFFYDFVTDEKTVALQTEKDLSVYLGKQMTITFTTENGIQNITEIHILETVPTLPNPIIASESASVNMSDISEEVHTVAATGPSRWIFSLLALLAVALLWSNRSQVQALLTSKKE